MNVTIRYYTLTPIACARRLLLLSHHLQMPALNTIFLWCMLWGWLSIVCSTSLANTTDVNIEPVEACVIQQDCPLNKAQQSQIAQCLGWQFDPTCPLCHGYYQPVKVDPLQDVGAVQVSADKVSLYTSGRSELKGHVEIRESQRIVTAHTAYIYRNIQTKQVDRIELVGGVRYVEPDRLMLAKSARINPEDKSGQINDVLYRFNIQRANAVLPAWGKARQVERFPNQNYRLCNATYSTCAPEDSAWSIEAREITLNHAKSEGVAKHALLRLHSVPLIYVPYLSFPTSKERKSGFLAPITGYSNIGGVDIQWPYYWNIAPNYDATFIPHLYTRRGMMLGAETRYLTFNSAGALGGQILPKDQAFRRFLNSNQLQYPNLAGISDTRWSFFAHDSTQLTPNLHFGLNYQQVSDDYYLQDFSTNLALLTQNQLLREGDLTYRLPHWVFNGMMQSYQTLSPINQVFINNAYARFPQLIAQGAYDQLPLGANLNLLGQMDNFRWPVKEFTGPQGPRFHADPLLSFPQVASWGYITPQIEVVENYYDLQYGQTVPRNTFNRTIPRYGVDGGIYLERSIGLMGSKFIETLEPRLFYLYVPYRDQTPIPVFDSAYMIFNTDQLFRTNRFSGFDRIGDTNQLSYALTSKWLCENSGMERASVTVGQIRYFADRQVKLCQSPTGNCTENPLYLGYVSPTFAYSPIASLANYRLNRTWSISTSYVWDPATRATNNAGFNLHYQPGENRIIHLGYSYLTDGNLTPSPNNLFFNGALNQSTVSFAWPFTEHWSSLGIYSYNMSKGYNMINFLGLQYDSCCWAFRLLGGRTFKSLTPSATIPQYDNNVYVQVLLKGLGSVSNSDPESVFRSYLPGYTNIFH